MILILYIFVFFFTGFIGMIMYALSSSEKLNDSHENELKNCCFQGAIIGTLWLIIVHIILHYIFKI